MRALAQLSGHGSALCGDSPAQAGCPVRGGSAWDWEEPRGPGAGGAGA